MVGAMIGCATTMDTPDQLLPSRETEKVAAVPRLVQTAKEVAAKMSSGTRRDDRSESAFERHVQAADTGISIAWRWATILIMLVGFGVTIGTFRAETSAMKDSIADLRKDMRDYSMESKQVAIQLDRNTRDIVARDRELSELSNQVKELRSQLDTVRNMREAYVYDSAKSARNKLLQQATTPP